MPCIAVYFPKGQGKNILRGYNCEASIVRNSLLPSEQQGVVHTTKHFSGLHQTSCAKG